MHDASVRPPEWQRRIIDRLIHHRFAVLLVVALVTAIAAFYARRLTFDSNIEVWFLEDDESLLTYRSFLEQFHADEIEVVGIISDDVFKPDLLKAVDGITRQAEKLENVHRVHSLTNVKVIRSLGVAHVSVEKLAEDLPRTAESARKLREEALSNPLVSGILVSGDGRATAVVVEMDPAGNNVEAKSAVVRGLEKIARRNLPPGVEWHLAGSPSFDEAFFRYSERDFMLLAPFAALVVLGICLALLRRTKVALVPLAVVVLSVIWTFGLMGLLGCKINVISTSLIPIVLAVGVADGIHVVSEYYQELMEGKPHGEAVAYSASSLITPCFFTSLTTVMGFLSLLTSSLKPVFEFGWLAASGVVIAFALTMTVLPAVFSLLPPPDPAVIARERAGWLAPVLARLGRPGRRDSLVVLGCSALLLAGSLYSLPGLQVGANPLNYFRPDDPIRTSTYRVDEALGGTASFDFLVNTQPQGLKEPTVLKRLRALERKMESMPAVSNLLSVLDSLREVRRVMTDGRRESAVIPKTRPEAAQFYLMIEGDEEFRRNVLGNYQTTRLTARVRISDSEKLIARIPELSADLRENYRDRELSVEATGYIKLMNDMETYLLDSQIRSLLIAFVTITIMMGLLLRSVRLALFSLIPNLLPIVCGLAFMSVAGIALDPGTVMIGGMALGLVVDDTVHFLVRLSRNLGSADLREAIDRTMTQTGRPIIFTSIILAAGCATAAIGSFSPTVYFGLVSALVVVMALVADLVLLPAALLIIAPRMR